MRRLEIIAQDEDCKALLDLIDQFKIHSSWSVETLEDKTAFNFVLDNGSASALFQKLEERPNYDRVTLYNIEGVLPRPKIVVDPAFFAGGSNFLGIKKFSKLSREEIYHTIEGPAQLNANYIWMVLLSSLVAGFGLLKNSEAILVGAMVIAPFLGPNIALSFGTTLGDFKLTREALKTALVGTSMAIVISLLWGYVDGAAEIPKDISIEYRDIILALVCGFTGVLSVVSSQASTLVGVMVAAALLPPLMRAGLLLGGGHPAAAAQSALIFAANIVCLNIAGILSFNLFGFRPGRWFEREKAKRNAVRSLIIWIVILIALVAIIHLIRTYAGGQ